MSGRGTDPYVCVPRDSTFVFAEVEEYSPTLPLVPAPKSVLDIGAHVGAYALKAARQWPDAQIRSYEPDPVNASLLRHNTRGLHVEVWDAAVTDGVAMTRMPFFPGKRSTGGSLHELGWQEADPIDVEAIGAGILPPADVVKIDTEGSEVAIVRAYKHWRGVRAAFIEWHTPAAYIDVRSAMLSHGFRVTKDKAGSRTGVLVFER